MKKILVTGGSGFIGTNFINFLAKKKFKVANLDKISKISVEMKKLLADNIYLDSILKNGCEKAEKIANKNIRDLKSLIGFFGV